jgi:alkanesulfonate monooxygenase SsuD/methylene tetrahydromethanopterin reductase-like flavin-dependent oxidoreductase (luciferase family)
MEMGILHSFQNYRDLVEDGERVRQAMALADLYDPLGFDFCLAAEHHFHGYTMSPVPFDFLSWLAGRTKRIKLGPGVIIIPWNDPYRAAAHLIMLDHLSEGRAMIGFGRGLAQLEMDHFGIDMNETRAMFDEGSRKILEALKTGSFPGGGSYHSQQDRSPMRPAPRSTDWDDRFLCVGMSPASVVEAGRLGARLMSFAQVPWDIYRETHLAPYLAAFRESHPGREPGPLVLAENVIVHEDRERAEELAQEYIGNYFDSMMDFYELEGENIHKVKGYESYAQAADATKHMARAEKRRGYVGINLYGTPADVIEQLRERRRVLDHPFDSCALVDVGGIPPQIAEDMLRLISREILPVVKGWDADFRVRQAEAAE